ncbi:hypothetical protein [Arthrobacter sp. W4I7]|uniref:hypothetical protein n=1 Tax=Arthrobacter sp. W4I7 TaxID=3042296 RepID=UPI0027815881|nr:hypothetical protein [Arthrobacter sp. W4I7]MDQ0693200.1 hypothetical protein [Arthrobacter sp. W4I7]
MMTEIPETDTDPDYGFDDDYILGDPPAMPDEVWESSLAAALNWADVDESLYPEDIVTDVSGAEGLQIDLDDIGPAGFYSGQEPERSENWNDHDDGH